MNPKWLGPVAQSVVSSIADAGIVRSIGAQYFLGGWSWNSFYRHFAFFQWLKKAYCQLQANVCAQSTA